jgi:NitT/TauT family transport system permease protein
VNRRVAAVSLPVVVTAVALVLWQLASVVFQVKTVVLPSPLVIAREMVGQAGLLGHHLWPTFYQTVLGFLLSVAGGILVAVLITYSRIVRTGVYPLIVVSQIIPKVSVAPLFVIWFGMGNTSRLLLAFLVAFFPMTINAAAGFQSVEEDYIRMARAYMGSRWQIFSKIRLPHALPYIFSGMKISITLAIIGVVVAEFVASQEGIGYLIVFANGLLDTPLMMAAITVLSLMGLLLYGLISAIERWAIYWQSSSDRVVDGTA